MDLHQEMLNGQHEEGMLKGKCVAIKSKAEEQVNAEVKDDDFFNKLVPNEVIQVHDQHSLTQMEASPVQNGGKMEENTHWKASFEEEIAGKCVAVKSPAEKAIGRGLSATDDQLDYLVELTRSALRDDDLTSLAKLNKKLLRVNVRWLADMLTCEGPRVAAERAGRAVQMALEDERILSHHLEGEVFDLWRSLTDQDISTLSDDFAQAYERAAFEAGQRALMDSGVVPRVIRETQIEVEQVQEGEESNLVELHPSLGNDFNLNIDVNSVKEASDECEAMGMKKVILHAYTFAAQEVQQQKVAEPIVIKKPPPHVITILRPHFVDMSKLFSHVEDKFALRGRGRAPRGRPRGRPPLAGRKRFVNSGRGRYAKAHVTRNGRRILSWLS